MKLPEAAYSVPGLRRVTCVSGGLERAFLVHEPPSAQPASIVLGLHGGGGSAALMAFATGWNTVADRRSQLVIYPEGTRLDPARPASFLRNPQMWNVGSGIGHAEPAGTDDVAFLAVALRWARQEYALASAPAFAFGFSMGSSLAYRCAAELPNQFRAIAAVSGHWWTRAQAGQPSGSLIAIAGTADPVNPLHGGAVTTPWGQPVQTAPIRASVEAWATGLGCSASPRRESGPNVTREFWTAPNATEVQFLVVAGMGHVWPGGRSVLAERIAGPVVESPSATAEIDQFLAAHGA